MTRRSSCSPQPHSRRGFHLAVVRGDAFVGERLAQSEERIAHATLHRVLVHPRQLGDLLESEPDLLAQHEYLALLGRKGRQRSLQDGPKLRVGGAPLRSGPVVLDAVDPRPPLLALLDVERLGPAETIPPRRVDAEVPRDGVEPRLEARAVLLRRGSLDDAQERLLRQVLCSGAISQHPHEEGEEGPAVAVLVCRVLCTQFSSRRAISGGLSTLYLVRRARVSVEDITADAQPA